MSTISTFSYNRYYRLPYTYMDVGSVSIPVAVPEVVNKPKRKRNRNNRKKRNASRPRNVSISSSHRDVTTATRARNGKRKESNDKSYRTRAESFGAQSTTSRTNYSRRGSFVRQNNNYGQNQRSNYGRYDGNQDNNVRWDRDRMSRQIWRFYENNRQTPELMTRKSHLKEALQKILVTNFADYRVELHIVGSTANGLGGNQSDMDICLIMDKKKEKTQVGSLVEIEDDSKEKTQVAEIVKLDSEPRETKEECSDKLETSLCESIGKASSSNGVFDESVPMLEKIRDVLQGCNFVMKMQIIMAKVPILKFVDRISQIEVTLNVNKIVSIRNTQLIRDYTKMDWRLQPLVMVIKSWAKDHNIKDAYNKSISSYSLVLMVIHYLQYGCDPPVLPCLQRMDPNKYSADAPIHEVLRKKRWNRRWSSRNNSTLKELLIGFLDYYSYVFSYESDVVSIRLGHPISKTKLQSQRFPFLVVEEPFDKTNTAHSVYDRVTFERILSVFRVSHYTLRRYPFLNSIMAGNRFGNETIGRCDAYQPQESVASTN